jgi:dihydrofolate reductase
MPTLPPLTAIVAMTSQRIIGREGQLPWHYPEDLKFFRQTTTGHTLLMGRKTYESIGKPLPNRRNIVLSRSLAPDSLPGVEVIQHIHQLAELPGITTSDQKIFLIGGADLYAQFLPHCRDLYLTRVEKDYPGDTALPAFEHHFDQGTLLHTAPGLAFYHHERLAQ